MLCSLIYKSYWNKLPFNFSEGFLELWFTTGSGSWVFVEGRNFSLKDVYILIPRTCKYAVSWYRRIKVVEGIKFACRLIIAYYLEAPDVITGTLTVATRR